MINICGQAASTNAQYNFPNKFNTNKSGPSRRIRTNLLPMKSHKYRYIFLIIFTINEKPWKSNTFDTHDTKSQSTNIGTVSRFLHRLSHHMSREYPNRTSHPCPSKYKIAWWPLSRPPYLAFIVNYYALVWKSSCHSANNKCLLNGLKWCPPRATTPYRSRTIWPTLVTSNGSCSLLPS